MMQVLIARGLIAAAAVVLAWTWHAIDKKMAVNLAVKKIEAEHIADLKEAVVDYKLRSLALSTAAIHAATEVTMVEQRLIEEADEKVRAELDKMKSKFKSVWPAHVVKALNK
jgi:hypothetical protein